MKRIWITIVYLGILANMAVAQDDPETQSPDEPAAGESDAARGAEDGDGNGDDGKLATSKQKTSYAIGASIGRGLKRDGADVDAALVARGLVEAFGGGELLLTDEQIRDLVIAFQIGLSGNGESAEGPRDGAAFLEENNKKEGVVTLPSGLQYRVIKEGDGATPKATDRVRTHYTGRLIDGTKFDSSVDRGEPAVFEVGGVIKGWTEALKLMKVGSKWELVIPAELGYGDNPPPGKIKPGDVLVFEIELLGIE